MMKKQNVKKGNVAHMVLSAMGKRKSNSFIALSDAHRNAYKRTQSKIIGIRLYYTPNKIKLIVGAVLACVGLITLPLPTGSALLIGLGLSMVSNNSRVAKVKIQTAKNKFSGGVKKVHLFIVTKTGYFL